MLGLNYLSREFDTDLRRETQTLASYNVEDEILHGFGEDFSVTPSQLCLSSSDSLRFSSDLQSSEQEISRRGSSELGRSSESANCKLDRLLDPKNMPNKSLLYRNLRQVFSGRKTSNSKVCVSIYTGWSLFGGYVRVINSQILLYCRIREMDIKYMSFGFVIC